jgi:hypothetical protein
LGVIVWENTLLICGYVGMCCNAEDGEINILTQFMDFQSPNNIGVNKRVIRYYNSVAYLWDVVFAEEGKVHNSRYFVWTNGSFAYISNNICITIVLFY